MCFRSGVSNSEPIHQKVHGINQQSMNISIKFQFLMFFSSWPEYSQVGHLFSKYIVYYSKMIYYSIYISFVCYYAVVLLTGDHIVAPELEWVWHPWSRWILACTQLTVQHYLACHVKVTVIVVEFCFIAHQLLYNPEKNVGIVCFCKAWTVSMLISKLFLCYLMAVIHRIMIIYAVTVLWLRSVVRVRKDPVKTVPNGLMSH